MLKELGDGFILGWTCVTEKNNFIQLEKIKDLNIKDFTNTKKTDVTKN